MREEWRHAPRVYKLVECPHCGHLALTSARRDFVCPRCRRRTSMSLIEPLFETEDRVEATLIYREAVEKKREAEERAKEGAGEKRREGAAEEGGRRLPRIPSVARLILLPRIKPPREEEPFL